MTTENRTVIVEGNSAGNRVVVETGHKQITVRGSETRSVVYVRGGTTGGGGSNATSIAGYPVSITNPTEFDVLSFTGSGFANRRQIELTDGGNF